MLLIVIRHAHAGVRDPAQWPDDTQRPLTDKGRKQARDVGRFLRKRELLPGVVITSPWLRALQTAEVVAEAARVAQPLILSEGLAEDPDLVRLADDIGDRPPEAIVGLVGHSPWMEELAAELLGGSASSLRIDLPKAGVVGIDLPQLAAGSGELRFMLRPKLI